MKYVAFASAGNDSVALVQWLSDQGVKDVTVAYSNTGWGASWWPARIIKFEEWVKSLGYDFVELPSTGMPDLVRMKKGWPMPRAGFQFCTLHLKILPSLEYLDRVDPASEVTCVVGVRREESRNRSQFPEWTEESEKHGGRSLWAPLVRVLEEERNALIAKTPFEVLPYRSKECDPCIYANRGDLRGVEDAKIDQIEALEVELGFTEKGKPRYMFRPYRFMGAEGIREIIRWANSERGQYRPDDPNDECDSGYCGV